MARPLNALMAGEQTAVTLGLNARVRLRVFVIASLMTGVLVSISGSIGFVGLMVPHIARRLVGPNIGVAAGVRVARQRVSGVGRCGRANPDRAGGPAHRRRHCGHRRPVLHRFDARR
jgi:hypothetical protein